MSVVWLSFSASRNALSLSRSWTSRLWRASLSFWGKKHYWQWHQIQILANIHSFIHSFLVFSKGILNRASKSLQSVIMNKNWHMDLKYLYSARNLDIAKGWANPNDCVHHNMFLYLVLLLIYFTITKVKNTVHYTKEWRHGFSQAAIQLSYGWPFLAQQVLRAAVVGLPLHWSLLYWISKKYTERQREGLCPSLQ